MASNKKTVDDPATIAWKTGYSSVDTHPLFTGLCRAARVIRTQDSTFHSFPQNGWADVSASGLVRCHPKRRGTPEEWAYVIAHCLLHLAFDHFQNKLRPEVWNITCDVFVDRFLDDLKFGHCPEDMLHPQLVTPISEQELYQRLCHAGVPKSYSNLGTAGPAVCDMVFDNVTRLYRPLKWPDIFATGLRLAVTKAVKVAAGTLVSMNAEAPATSIGQRARKWFIDHYPLLGSVAAEFKIIENLEMCRQLEVETAAVCRYEQEIYLNPLAGLSEQEAIFVIAHEILHAALRHDIRCGGRDFYLFNVACDFVVNGWLIEMAIGAAPKYVLHDLAFKGLSVEAVYDNLCTDLRRARKLMTLRGRGGADMIDGPTHGVLTNRDDFVRRALMHGLEYHCSEGRSLLPAGLIEEIRALEQPPVPWEVDLAHWFDERFQTVENDRTFRRLSRRQESTPDIPRPRYMPDEEDMEGRTFGVVIDTSGSMPRTMLGRALGTVVSYAYAKDVNHIRVIFCDAAAYDQGYMDVTTLVHRVKVRGRGGTVLQPGIDTLEHAKDFPKDAPIMIITDGDCDVITIKRDHCIICPAGAKLPFVPRGPVFRMRWKMD